MTRMGSTGSIWSHVALVEVNFGIGGTRPLRIDTFKEQAQLVSTMIRYSVDSVRNPLAILERFCRSLHILLSKETAKCPIHHSGTPCAQSPDSRRHAEGRLGGPVEAPRFSACQDNSEESRLRPSGVSQQ